MIWNTDLVETLEYINLIQLAVVTVAGAVNRLLVVGFYLLDLGFVTLFMRIGGTVGSIRACFEALSVKIGTVLLVLGVFHLFNVYLLARIRRRSVRLQEREAA